MTWAVLKAGKERVFMDMRDIYAVWERPDKKGCDVYTALFPDGVTIDHPFDLIINTYQEVMNDADQDGELESPDGDGDGDAGCALCVNGECQCGADDDGPDGVDGVVRSMAVAANGDGTD